MVDDSRAGVESGNFPRWGIPERVCSKQRVRAVVGDFALWYRPDIF
jgi:hypothetical protein